MASINGTKKPESIFGSEGSDFIKGLEGNDRLYGLSGNDWLFGGAGNDTLFGGTGIDHLDGGDGDDVLQGGAGFDYMKGGAGRDRFVFTEIGFNKTATYTDTDMVYDFEGGLDKLDFSQIDANTKVAGNQAFHYTPGTELAGTIGDHFTGHAGELISRIHPTKRNMALIEGDVNGDSVADFRIDVILVTRALKATDFIF